MYTRLYKAVLWESNGHFQFWEFLLLLSVLGLCRSLLKLDIKSFKLFRFQNIRYPIVGRMSLYGRWTLLEFVVMFSVESVVV